jgi:hypothetical protein
VERIKEYLLPTNKRSEITRGNYVALVAVSLTVNETILQLEYVVKTYLN